MSQHSVSSSQPAFAWHAEAQRLLAKPFVVGQGAYREGQSITRADDPTAAPGGHHRRSVGIHCPTFAPAVNSGNHDRG